MSALRPNLRVWPEWATHSSSIVNGCQLSFHLVLALRSLHPVPKPPQAEACGYKPDRTNGCLYESGRAGLTGG